MTEATTLEQRFSQISHVEDIPKVFTDEEKQIIGDHLRDDPTGKVLDNTIIQIVFDLSLYPPPSTFNLTAFIATVVPGACKEAKQELSSEIILKFALSTGLMNEAENQRFSVPLFVSEAIARIPQDELK